MLQNENAVGNAKPAPATLQITSPAEATVIHTNILRLALALEESIAYWTHRDPRLSAPAQAITAFEQRWFGAKSLGRIRFLMASFALRYDAFPKALQVLSQWPSMDLKTRKIICHIHLQLSDPIYRKFTSEFLIQRRILPQPTVDRDAVLRWLKIEFPKRWSEATYIQFASKLLSAAFEAELISKRDPRTLHFPRIGDHALAYLLYLLRETRFEGSLCQNPYLVSIGLDQDLLAQRARTLPGLSMRRMMHLVEFEWAYPDLASWAAEIRT